MARQSRSIEPINASFEELAKAVISPKHKEKDKESENKASTSNSEKIVSKSCKSSSKHSGNTHIKNK